MIKFNIKRIYVKDSSFESPQSPKIFEDATSSPKIGFNLNSDINKISLTNLNTNVEDINKYFLTIVIFIISLFSITLLLTIADINLEQTIDILDIITIVNLILE